MEMKNNEWNVPSEYFEKNKKALMPVRKFPTGKWLLALAAACVIGVGFFMLKGDGRAQEIAEGKRREEDVREGKKGEDVGAKNLSPNIGEDIGAKNLSPNIGEDIGAKNLSTKEDIGAKNLSTKEDIGAKNLSTKEDIGAKNLSTKEDIGSKHLSTNTGSKNLSTNTGSKNLSTKEEIAEELKEIPREELVAYLLEEDSELIENLN
jgi:hypothetical protein